MSSLLSSGAPMSNQEILHDFVQSLLENAQQANAPAPFFPPWMPEHSVSHIQALYSQKVGYPVIPCLTTSGQMTFKPLSPPMPTAPSPAPVPSADTRDRKSKAKVPRPANAFILYRQHHHPLMKDQFPGIVNNDISKKVAALWKDEREEVKAAWKAKADEAKQQHLQQHPDYSYQPRKPSEKKRRMTKSKMAMSSAPVVFVDNKAQQLQTPQQALPAFTLNSLDLAPMSCNPSAMADNAVEAIDFMTETIDQILEGDIAGMVDLAAAQNWNIGLASRDMPPVNFDDIDIFNSPEAQGLEDMLEANFSPVSATGVATMGPADPFWEGRDNLGFMMTDDQIQNQQFLNTADAKYLEQIRQESLFQESENFNVWHPNPLFF
ncbi:putative mating type 1-2-1 protein [Venturia nashicola]|uniref:Putative mating type 1-2-1 protein n=1 Tax=Venturia nashicola TaxID=86259 RepID=A0A4Z1P4S3_9PEZI|nr:putative mating type 1-2-1 protein [Venturia nashicola]